MTSVEIVGLSFSFNPRVKLFNELTLSMSSNGRGRTVALVGPSGCGKTTFCRLLLGLLRPKKGIVKLEPAAGPVAYVPQNPVLYSGLSLEENLTCLKESTTLGRTFTESACRQAVDALGLTVHRAAEREVASLSGGEAQRVMLVRVLSADARLLVLDEPFACLDNRSKQSVQDALSSYISRNDAVAFFVTHSWAEARQLADDALFFESQSEKGVQVLQRTIDQAEALPPTIGAFYTMRWPHCALVRRDDLLAQVPRLQALSGPSGNIDAAFLGISSAMVGASARFRGTASGALVAQILNEIRENSVHASMFELIEFDVAGAAIRRIWPRTNG